jgi:hypothetical protein
MKYIIEMGSGIIICIPSLIYISSTIQKLIGTDTQAHRQNGESIRLFSYFFKIRKVG